MEAFNKYWFSQFPGLKVKLSQAEKDILDKIDPADYMLANITRESEVIDIISRHKPQAWKWERVYPGLKNLPAEDHDILDTMSPDDFITEMTEKDVLNMIKYYKDKKSKSLEDLKKAAAEKYYAEHKEEIEEESRLRSKLTKRLSWSMMAGIALITAGITMASGILISSGVAILITANILYDKKLYDLNSNTVIPPVPSDMPAKLDYSSVLFIVFYYVGFIGAGMALGSSIIWAMSGWNTAEPVLLAGLFTISGSVLLFLFLLVISPSDRN